MKKISRASHILLEEALRRYMCFHINRDKSLRSAWTGLGYKTNYKPALTAGLMTWVHGPPLRCHKGWLHLTGLGVHIVKYWMEHGHDTHQGNDPCDYRVSMKLSNEAIDEYNNDSV